ncbi:MAG: SNF2 helicase-associated domain-containing protein, partial [Acidimicrobiales bacterium]
MARRSSLTTEREPDHELVLDVARALVATGRVVPGLTVDDNGRGRSWWWPLPAASHRSLVASLVVDPSAEGQRLAATRLAEEVDALVRTRLASGRVLLAPKRAGRPTVTEAWARSLVSVDPWLAATLPDAKVRALAAEVQTWVRTGAVLGGRCRLCLRVNEPARGDVWTVELLAQDRDEPSLIVPLADVWAGQSPFGRTVVEDLLASLGRLVRLAPELGAVLDVSAPTDLALDGAAVVRLLHERVGPLDDADIGVLLPGWWSTRPQLGLRAKAKRASSAASITAVALGMDTLVDFSWEAALGAQRLTKADLAALARAADAKRSLVRLRGQWVEVDRETIQALLDGVGSAGQSTAGELLRAGLGLDALGRQDDVEVVGVDAAAVPWLSSLLDDALHATVEPVPTPPGFDGALRP